MNIDTEFNVGDSAICRKVRGKHTANGYRCFFEDSNDWYNLIKQDYE